MIFNSEFINAATIGISLNIALIFWINRGKFNKIFIKFLIGVGITVLPMIIAVITKNIMLSYAISGLFVLVFMASVYKSKFKKVNLKNSTPFS